MRSVKPGRGPSGMGAIGSIGAGLFGVLWTIGAAQMGAPLFFVGFGVIFVGIAVAQGIYHYKNATGKNRMSLMDITSGNEEPDPLDSYFRKSSSSSASYSTDAYSSEDNLTYCPYCGNKLANEAYRFCPSCGKELKQG
ncbi:zinc ribbon domain-containing protein [Paenibacillus sp. PK3_47]|nr:zinc ribbon domain-containing protein [Paenibacillus sp. PK3_47]